MNYKNKFVEWGVPLFAAAGVLALGLFTAGCGGGGGSDSPAATSTQQKNLNGVWRSTGTGGAFSYLLMFTDGTFAYGENDPLVTAPDNGLEVGTYTYSSTSGNITFNVVYDDNGPGTNSGVGDIGTPSVIDAVLSNNDNTLTIANGAVVLSAVDFGVSPLSGAWRNTGAGGAFEIMVLTDDGAFFYGENDLAAAARANGENGLEVGSYSYNSTTGDITFTIIYDDNGVTVGNSGVGDIGTPAVIPAVLTNANATLTIAGSIVLTREF